MQTFEGIRLCDLPSPSIRMFCPMHRKSLTDLNFKEKIIGVLKLVAFAWLAVLTAAELATADMAGNAGSLVDKAVAMF
jgi:hypothetical protein